MRGNVKTLLAAAILACCAGAARADGPAADSGDLPVYPTAHYTLRSDVDPDLAIDLGRRLDAMFDEYAKRLVAFGPERVPRQDVYVFARRVDYMRFVGDRMPNTGGVFIPSRGCLAAYLEGQGRDALRRTLQHEAFHQFAQVVISPDLPVWLNEGMAQVFEESIYTGRAFVVAQVPERRLRQLRADLSNDRLAPFETFVGTDHRTWAATMRDRDRGATQYNQAWAMVHFLVYAYDGAKDEYPYRNRFFAMLQQIKAGANGYDAFVANFGSNFAGFERRFQQYAASVTATKESTYLENAEVLSDLMAEILNVEKLKFRSLADFRTHLERGGYQLKYTKGQLRWSTDPNVSVYFRDAIGRELPPGQAMFITNPSAPLPDLILRPEGQLEYRARFFTTPEGRADREIVVRAF